MIGREGRDYRAGLRVVFCMVVVVVTVFIHSWALAQGGPIMVGISPLTSKVSDISAEEAQELFINALMETNVFAIRPPDASGSYAGSSYVFEPTITEAKAKNNVLGFLKDVATSKAPVTLTVRVFDPRSNALLKSVSVKSTEAGAAQVTVGDVQSLIGALGAAKSGQADKGEQPDQSSQLEERLGGMMQQAAARLVAQLGAAGAGVQRPGAAQRR